jgi:hypothetical protein
MTAAIAMFVKPFVVIAFIIFVRSINWMAQTFLPNSVSEFLLKKR